MAKYTGPYSRVVAVNALPVVEQVDRFDPNNRLTGTYEKAYEVVLDWWVSFPKAEFVRRSIFVDKETGRQFARGEIGVTA